MESYWEAKSLKDYDYIVVGGGFMGWNMAIEIQTARPKARVIVLEQGHFTGSASLRNAGFACMGSLTELLEDLQSMDEEAVLSLFARRQQGLAISRQRYGDSAIGYRENGSYEVLFEPVDAYVEAMESMNQRLLPLTKKPAFALATSSIESFGFASHRVQGLIENLLEGELDAGMLWLSCQRHAVQLGVEYRTGARVRDWISTEQGVEVHLDPLPWIQQEPWQLRAKQLFICTNAQAAPWLPGVDLEPGRGQVLLTHPIPGMKWKGCFHFDAGYYYFRELDGRLLLGGGRNLDFDGERTFDHGLNPEIQESLENHIRRWILPGISYEVAHRWSGIMGFGREKSPLVFARDERVFIACRLGGMGVALAPQLARELWAMSRGRRIIPQGL